MSHRGDGGRRRLVALDRRIADVTQTPMGIVYAFRRGASPESIQRSFPTLTLEQVYGAIE